ncbi:DNA-binding GntR family transcriptional regulator [Roseibium hamelinense]|uniref:DNA-binding GntR family transcriptional regulator n=2 Tax=Roseibium hamelinense TaxID=150831 RepID=A0A562SX82_9HYPH|nr:DNA-binding GntR family transcriptional regulator [Roseibium hamelinense]
MSRTPVREALIRLEAEGLLELMPRRGARIIGVKQSDLKDVYEILEVLLPVAVAGAARSGVDGEQSAFLEGLIRQLERAADDKSAERWLEADDQFHLALTSLHGNMRLYKQMRDLLDQIFRPRTVLAKLREQMPVEPAYHWALLNAVDDLRPEDAADRVLQNLRANRDGFDDMFERCGLKVI